jgi:2-(3-amino-3-carboxypropyl)histidine synthase
VVDPFLGKAINVNKIAKKFIQLKKSAERRFFEARRIGIILGLKSHQLKMNYVKNLYSRLMKIGKDPVILCAREITPDNLNDFLEFQAFINTACPRIAIDNRHLFHKPILNYDEVLFILKIMEENFEEKTT